LVLGSGKGSIGVAGGGGRRAAFGAAVGGVGAGTGGPGFLRLLGTPVGGVAVGAESGLGVCDEGGAVGALARASAPVTFTCAMRESMRISPVVSEP
jgi:hypothetical protein